MLLLVALSTALLLSRSKIFFPSRVVSLKSQWNWEDVLDDDDSDETTPLIYSSEEIESFRWKMSASMEERVELEPLEAAEEAGKAASLALQSGAKLVKVDVRAGLLNPDSVEDFDEVCADQWMRIVKIHCEGHGTAIHFAPTNVKDFRAALKEVQRTVVVNPKFSVDPVEFDDAITAYAFWPMKARDLPLRVCVQRRYPRPWALFIDDQRTDEGYVRAATFDGDAPPSDEKISDAIIVALESKKNFDPPPTKKNDEKD